MKTQHEMKDDESPPSPTMEEETTVDTVVSTAGGSSSDVNANTLRNQMKRQKKKLKKAKTAGASAIPTAAVEAELETGMETGHAEQTSADGKTSNCFSIFGLHIFDCNYLMFKIKYMNLLAFVSS